MVKIQGLRYVFSEDTSLLGLIFQNGTFYFMIIFTLDLLEVLCNSVAPSWITGFINAFKQPLSAIFISHYILDLRSMIEHPNPNAGPTLTTLQAASNSFKSTIVQFAHHVPHANREIKSESNPGDLEGLERRDSEGGSRNQPFAYHDVGASGIDTQGPLEQQNDFEVQALE
ncbi:hypothetical protein K439DRAFT_1633422 [Ramaria rubella]|nr:hypothetical protein K439DRAFT_1633422 [Ramaria rubella]